MFKIISAVFSTGFAVGAASAVLAIHRGHIELAGNQQDPAEIDDVHTGATTGREDTDGSNAAGTESDKESDPDIGVAVADGREVS